MDFDDFSLYQENLLYLLDYLLKTRDKSKIATEMLQGLFGRLLSFGEKAFTASIESIISEVPQTKLGIFLELKSLPNTRETEQGIHLVKSHGNFFCNNEAYSDIVKSSIE